ncbi:MAG: hypothetical protein ABII00_04370 [Elusimicrobiota bacterium]
MPSSGRRGTDPLKEYWWVPLIIAVLIGVWISMARMPGTGSDSVVIPRQASTTEQSLRSLDEVGTGTGAPGDALGRSARAARSAGAGAEGREAPASGLYRSPGSAKGSPITKEEEAAAELARGGGKAGAGSLADALKKVASSGKAPDHGWGGKEVRTGFSRPRAKFGKVGTTRGGGAGSTSAQLTVDKPFGTGGDPGLKIDPGAGLSARDRSVSDPGGSGANQSLDSLKRADKQLMAGLDGADEIAAAGGRRTFDGAGVMAGTALDQLKAAGQGSGVGSGAGVPQNLKTNDPNLDMKEFEAPEIPEAAQVKDDDNQDYMTQQILMMVMGVALSGMAGPGVGGMMMMGVNMMGMFPPSGGDTMDKL